jgi:CHAD domain-containing protein
MKLKPALSAAENARAILPKMARKYFEAGRKAIDEKRPAEELHAFRLETKRFRYSLELFRPVYGPQLDRYLEALRELQGVLGKISDYQAIKRLLAGDRELKAQIQHALKEKVKDLRDHWRAFDSEGELKRWRTYLASEHSKPRKRRVSSAVPKKPVGRAQARARSAAASGADARM